MPLGGLQHYTVEPHDLEKTKDFYVDVLGLDNGASAAPCEKPTRSATADL